MTLSKGCTKGVLDTVVPYRMYAFDVHCNSYFPLFILLYGELLLQTCIPSRCVQTALLSLGLNRTLLCCSGTVLVLACAVAQESFVNNVISNVVRYGAELLPLSELPRLQRAAISRSHRGESIQGLHGRWCAHLDEAQLQRIACQSW